MEEIRQQFEARRAAILQRKSEVVSTLIDDVADRKGDSIDISNDEQTESTQLALEGRLATELIEIDAALQRIADGDYGDCEECGDEIPKGRLKIQPLDRHCVDCQEELEVDAKRRYRRPGLMDECVE